jgi:LuxR family maltose regulon positive regulatory protein
MAGAYTSSLSAGRDGLVGGRQPPDITETVDHDVPILPRLDAFLETKLAPPVNRSSWVPRDELTVQLQQSTRNHALTLLAAPAGYGKTTLLAQWLASVAGRRSAFVALDAGDLDPVRLWTHIVTALQRAGCIFPDTPTRLVSTRGADLIRQLLPTVVNAIAALGEPLVLVLDDYHFVTSDECHEQISFVLRHLPSTAGLVISTRVDPALGLGRLRVAHQLAEIRADQLRFSLDATVALLAAEHIQLSTPAVDDLLQRTEGWPAGLYLAAMSLRGREDPDAFVHDFRGDDRFLGDYLTEEVLNRLPPEIRDFIVRATLLERFSAPLCDVTLQIDNSARILRDLERSNQFLVPLDGHRQWYRFHHLFGAVARGELAAESTTQQLNDLHGRAAEWFADHGYVDEAIRHAIAAGSTPVAARLVHTNWITYVDAGRTATVDYWLKTLRGGDGPPDPAASVTAAWIAMVRGHVAEFNALLDELENAPDIGALPDGTTSVRSALALLKGMTGYDGVVSMANAAHQAAELETDTRSPWYSMAQFEVGHAAYLTGNLEDAAAILPKAAYSDSAFSITRVLALGAMSMVAREQGEWTLSHQAALEAMAVVDGASLRSIPQVSFAFTALGESEFDAGNVSRGVAILEEGLLLRRKVANVNPWPTIYHLLAMGRVLTSAGDLSRARQLLDEAGQMLTSFPGEPGVMRARLARARAALRRRTEPATVLEPLTHRELEILRLLQTPMSLAALAAQLYVSLNTVKTHVQAIYRKLGATTRTEAIRIARQQSLI